jgi:Zn-dependent metalloprotease
MIFAGATIKTGAEANAIVKGSEAVILSPYSQVPDYVRFGAGNTVAVATVESWITAHFNMPAGSALKLLSVEQDNLGMVHYRYQQTINNIPVHNTMYIVHTKNGNVISMNGLLYDNNKLNTPQISGMISENDALAGALRFVSAGKYMWQNAGAEKNLKEVTRNPDATYFPKGELFYIPENNKPAATNFHLAYRFDIYAQEPFSRNYVFVDALTGKVIHSSNRIHNSDVNATAATQFSGSRTIVTDSYNGSYRLRESGRGGGIVTLNAQTSTNTNGSVDFTNATTTWNNVNAALDQYAPDAHLASEATYDFYKNNFGRNSVDGQGLQLVAYVHYDVKLENAFWDGQAMNYGDGNSANNTKPFTTLEIGGHEITHGLTQYTANLDYQDESGALNESFSDCMGTAIRQSVKQNANVDYLIGDELGTGSAFRSMSSPKTYQQPNTYGGLYWAAAGGADNGGVHTNSGVQNYWFYLVAHGGSGTNDNQQRYAVTGIGIDKTSAITYRNLTTYLVPTSQYADARTYSIQAATDLYGACSPEVITVTNAWYAVGVGDSFKTGVQADFNALTTTACSAPATFSFANASNNGANYVWDFGDGVGSTSANPSHTYAAYGTYTVKLSASSACGADSITKTQLIHVNNDAPSVQGQSICAGQTATLSATSAGTVQWYTTATGGSAIQSGVSYTTPVLNTSATYYAETQIPGAQYNLGPADYNFGTGGYFTNTNAHQEYFNCNAPQTLLTVDMYANSAGNRTVTLQDSAGNVLQSATVALVSGLNTVVLNFPIPVKNNLALSLSGTTNLYRNKTGASYPYTSPDGTLVITGSDAGSAYFYYFYNWQTQLAPCVSGRTPVQVTVLSTGSASFTYTLAGNTVNFTPSATGNVTYSWDFGDGSTSTDVNPAHTYTGTGPYTVTLVVNNGSCSETITQQVSLTATGIHNVTAINSLTVYPNPVNTVLHVQLNTAQPVEHGKLCITNILGENISSHELNIDAGQHSVEMDVAGLAPGVYFVSVNNGSATSVRRFVKSN